MYRCIKTYTLCSVFFWEFPTQFFFGPEYWDISGELFLKVLARIYWWRIYIVVCHVVSCKRYHYIFPLYEFLSIVIAQICNNKYNLYACMSKYVRNRRHFVHDNSFIKWSAIQVSYRKFSLEFRSYECCQFIIYIRRLFIKIPLC